MQIVIRLAVIVPFVTASDALAGELTVRPLLHTNQGELVRHSNQEGQWLQVIIEPRPVILPSTPPDLFSADLPDPWSHGNSPRMPTPPAHNIPGPGTVAVLAIALLGMPARRRRSVT